jgi:hypothetical protein
MASDMLDQVTLDYAAAHIKARAEAERLMRDSARRGGQLDLSQAHGDRAAALDEAAAAVLLLASVEACDAGR